MYSSGHLEALAAVCEAGSVDGAARRLGLTPSAVSQRLAGLEHATGRTLLMRTRPLTPTRAGRILWVLARRLILLTADTDAALGTGESGTRGSGSGTGMVKVSLAINADSVSTWFRPVIAHLAGERRILLDVHIADQNNTEDLLREGEVMAAVTTSNTPPPGCRVQALGTMTYWPACAPGLLAGRSDVERDPARLPMLRFDTHDDLQHAYLRQIGAHGEPPIHYVPSNHEFLTAARLGLGWGVLPEGQIARDLAEGTLTLLDPRRTVSVLLYWQRWELPSTILDHLTDLVTDAAHTELTQ